MVQRMAERDQIPLRKVKREDCQYGCGGKSRNLVRKALAHRPLDGSGTAVRAQLRDTRGPAQLPPTSYRRSLLCFGCCQATILPKVATCAIRHEVKDPAAGVAVIRSRYQHAGPRNAAIRGPMVSDWVQKPCFDDQSLKFILVSQTNFWIFRLQVGRYHGGGLK